MNKVLRKTAAGALSAAASVMAFGSRVTVKAADMLRGSSGQRPAGHDAPATTDDVVEIIGQGRQTDAARRATVTEPPTEPVAAAPSRVRTSESHTEELASRSASEVMAAIPDLSTDELGRLYEHEAAHKKRKTVLAAIERAVEPS